MDLHGNEQEIYSQTHTGGRPWQYHFSTPKCGMKNPRFVGSSHILAAQLPIVADWYQHVCWWITMVPDVNIKHQMVDYNLPKKPPHDIPLFVGPFPVNCVGQLSSFLDEQSPIPRASTVVSLNLVCQIVHLMDGKPIFPTEIPFGKHTNNYGTSQFLVGKSTINHHFQ